MMNKCKAIATLFAISISVFFGVSLYADTVAIPVDLSANVIESVLPGGTVFHDSKPLLGTTVEPVAELRTSSPFRHRR